MIDVEKLLKSTSDIFGYRIIENHTTSYETFYVLNHKKETVRSTDTTDISVTIYVKSDNTVGDSTFQVFADMSKEEVMEKIASAISRAKLVKNEAYVLPAGGEEEIELPSDFTDYSPKDLSSRISEAVYGAQFFEHGDINALEIFITKEEITVKNSNGINKKQTLYKAMIEAIPTWTENGESVELYEQYNFSDFDGKAITEEIGRRMKEVKDRQYAVVPKGIGSCRVLLQPQEISEIADALASDINYQSVYANSNLYSVGEYIQKANKGDGISITMKAKLKGSSFSKAFDDDGITLKDKEIISNGKIVGYHGASRFGQYLGEDEKSITGKLDCISLKSGSLTEEELKNKPYLDCVSLSGIQIDLFSDYIGGEIRLAYYHEGDKVTPVTGISMSGKLSDALNNIKFSKEIIVKGYYSGPSKALIDEINII